LTLVFSDRDPSRRRDHDTCKIALEAHHLATAVPKTR